mgnify:FL=1
MSRRRRHDPGARAAQRSALRARARRNRRRDTPRGYHYEPLRVDAKAAERGVRTRLLGGVLAGAMTFACALAVIFMAPDKFTFLALTALAVSGLLVAISLILSARREEIVHQLASDLQEDPQKLLTDEHDAHHADDLALDVLVEREPSMDAHARDGSL